MKKYVVLAIAAFFYTFGLPTTASAVTQGPYEKTVSCDATITDTLKTFFHASTGTLSFIKVSDTVNVVQAVNVYSAQGNQLGWKTVGTSGTVSWSNVLSSDYTFKIKPSTSMNCNGLWPGDGNMVLTYKVTHK